MERESSAVPVKRQRLSARALLMRDDDVLLTRIAETGFGTAGTWTLPGGGVDHGEHPEESLRREVREETGLEIEIIGVRGVFSRHFVGLSPTGVLEDFHGIHLVYDAVVTSPSDEPRVVEVGGTTDAVAWVGWDRIRAGDLPAAQVVAEVLRLLEGS